MPINYNYLKEHHYKDIWEKVLDEGTPSIYSVNMAGEIRNDRTGRIMSVSYNQQGIAKVTLVFGQGKTTVSVTPLVARTFLPKHNLPTFDTPINWDGDRTNNHVQNLAWRPKWFAQKYHRQFKMRDWEKTYGSILDIDTNTYYDSPQEVVYDLGVLLNELLFKAQPHFTKQAVFPTGHRFKFFDE